METTLREPAVAGAFYPGTASALERELRQLVTVTKRHGLLACIAPMRAMSTRAVSPESSWPS